MSPEASLLDSDILVENIVKDMLCGGSDVERDMEKYDSQELTRSQELEFSPSTSTNWAVSRMWGRHEGSGRIFQHSFRFLTLRRTGMDRQ